MTGIPQGAARPDWLSYTVWWADSKNKKTHEIAGKLDHVNKQLEACNFIVTDVQTDRKRRPYTHHLEFKDGLGGLYFNPKLGYGTVEFTGTDCLRMVTEGTFEKLLKCIANSVTRIDIAVDFETELRPASFVSWGYSDRIKTSSEIVSVTGETCYLGSMKGSRYCRIYRYEPPHPRSKFLRVELVARKDAAKVAANLLVSEGLDACIQFMSNNVKFEHPFWKSQSWSGIEAATIPTMDKDAVRTYSWLLKQVAPALHRLQAKGQLGTNFWLNFVPESARATITYEFNKTDKSAISRTEKRKEELREKYG